MAIDFISSRLCVVVAKHGFGEDMITITGPGREIHEEFACEIKSRGKIIHLPD